MAAEPGHIQISEFSRDVIPSINWMMEDLFCRYGVSIPYFMLDFDFPDFSERPDWVSGYNFNLDWGAWGYWLPWFNELLGLIWDEAHLPRLTLSDWSLPSVTMFNEYMNILYDNQQTHYVYGQSGTFTADEVIEGETSGITGYYKWKDGDGYIHVANKSAADFEEEKIVGADSGAYAWTYEDYWVSPMKIYATGGPQMIRKLGESVISLDDSWNEYDAANVVIGGSNYVPLWGTSTTVWTSIGREGCISFDTTDAPTNATTITLNIDIDSIINTFGNPILKIYRLDEAFSTSHWLSGGTLITSEELTATGVHSYSLTNLDINQGGTSRFRLSFTKLEAQTKPTEVVRQEIHFDTPVDEKTYLEFTI